MQLWCTGVNVAKVGTVTGGTRQDLITPCI